MRDRKIVLGCILSAAVASWPLSSSADYPPLPAPPPAAPPPAVPPPPAIPPPPPVPVSPELVDTFAEVVDDTTASVRDRLEHDSDLLPLALRAVDARRARKTSGRTSMIVGFSIVGVTEVVGTVVALSALQFDPSQGTSDWTRYDVGLAIDAIGAAIGLSVAIPGIVAISKTTDAENAAVQAYRPVADPVPPPSPPGPPPPAPPPPPLPSPGTAFVLPILTGTF